MDLALASRIDELNRQRAAAPHDAKVAQRWCAMALELGQPEKAWRCAAQFYGRAATLPSRAEWSRRCAQAAFRMLKLEDALAAFTVSLGHLCDLCERGQIPARIAVPPTPAAFSNGQAEELMWRTCAALTQAGFQAFPYAGTLLGLVREGHLLVGDKDIDLAIWEEDFVACCDWLQARGWKAARGGLPYKAFRAFLDPASGLTLDIEGVYRAADGQSVLIGFELEGYPPQYQSRRKYPLIDLALRASSAGEVWFVQQPEGHLAALYGDWRTPNPWWDSTISSLGMNEVTLLVRCYAYDRMLSRWSNGELERAWAYAHQILLKDGADLTALRVKKCLGAVLSRINPGALHWPPDSTRSYAE